jgi:hypothetical protein
MFMAARYSQLLLVGANQAAFDGSSLDTNFSFVFSSVMSLSELWQLATCYMLWFFLNF